MRALSVEEFEGESEGFDRAVSATVGIDHFCSSSDWVVPASVALMPEREAYLRRGEGGWAALMRHRQPAGWYSLEALEAAWGLACPLAGLDVALLVEELVADCASAVPNDVLVLSGVPRGSALHGALVARLGPRYRVETEMVPPARRYRARLDGGVDGFMGRRSAAFRANLRQASRRAAREAIRFEEVPARDEAEVKALYARALAIDARSWKGESGVGIADGGLEEFYRLMLPRLVRRQAVRARIARHRDRDVAYIFGGLIHGAGDGLIYRGLQFAFDSDYRAYGLGNVAQYEMIVALCEEGVSVYDLGSEVDYKRRWGEECMETLTVVGIPRR